SEAGVKTILTMPLALGVVEEPFRRLAEGSALLHSRQRLRVPGKSYLHYMAAADAKSGYMGLKIYSSSKEGLRFVIPLFSAESGDMLALIEADFLGQMRTGAASGVATRVMARDDARTIGMIGSGLQARTQLEAIALVRRIESARVFSRDALRRENFAANMSKILGIPVTATTSAEEAVREADIVVSSTTSSVPVIEGRWLRPGMHINAIGANFPQKRELDDAAVGRADVIAADSREQSRLESGDLIHALSGDPARWDSVLELADIVAGNVPGRTDAQQITLFKSNGIATEDIAVAARIYEIARERGIGREIPMWEREARPTKSRGV
ncbi:MAG: ornithine cyclodeaminase family protein, partial [Candidatus Binataceae bacterium]